MSGRSRLPGGTVRRASQLRSRPAAASASIITAPRWQPGDPVQWNGYVGHCLQIANDDDEQAELLIGALALAGAAPGHAAGVKRAARIVTPCRPLRTS